MLVFRLTSHGSKAFCEYSTHNAGKFSPVILDSRVVIDPTILQPICNGQIETTGNGNTSVDGPGDIAEVAVDLRFGVLPVVLQLKRTTRASVI